MQRIVELFTGASDEKSIDEQVKDWADQHVPDEELQEILFPSDGQALEVKIPDHVFHDLEIFQGNTEDSTPVLHSICRAHTPFGKCALKKMLGSPVANPVIIRQRQRIIQYFLNNQEITQSLEMKFSEVKDSCDKFAWFWRPQNEHEQTLHELIYFQLPIIGPFLNQTESVLNATSVYKMFISPAFTILTPMLMFIVPYIILRRMNVNLSFFQVFNLLKNQVFSVSFISTKTRNAAIISAAIWAFLYLQNVYMVLKYSALTNRVSNIIHDRLRSASSIVGLSMHCSAQLHEYPAWMRNLLEEPVYSKDVEKLLWRDTIRQEPGLFTNKGRILSTFACIPDNLEQLASIGRYVGTVDAYLSIVRYLREASKAKLPWTFAQFGGKKKMSKVWHPSLWKPDKNRKPVPNNLPLKNRSRVALITGPNAAGKSTFVRSVFVNALLAQTLGIACAKHWSVPAPFLLMDTYLNVPDVEGHASLFEAEMYRCLDFLQSLESKQDTPALIAMDEVFSSTNFREGFSAAYAVVRHLSTAFPHLLCLVTTHFHGLAQLEKNTKGRLRNICFKVKRGEKGEIVNYPFKVRRGVCTEHIALELLKENGFSHHIIDVANKVYKCIRTPEIIEAKLHLGK